MGIYDIVAVHRTRIALDSILCHRIRDFLSIHIFCKASELIRPSVILRDRFIGNFCTICQQTDRDAVRPCAVLVVIVIPFLCPAYACFLFFIGDRDHIPAIIGIRIIGADCVGNCKIHWLFTQRVSDWSTRLHQSISAVFPENPA